MQAPRTVGLPLNPRPTPKPEPKTLPLSPSLTLTLTLTVTLALTLTLTTKGECEHLGAEGAMTVPAQVAAIYPPSPPLGGWPQG